MPGPSRCSHGAEGGGVFSVNKEELGGGGWSDTVIFFSCWGGEGVKEQAVRLKLIKASRIQIILQLVLKLLALGKMIRARETEAKSSKWIPQNCAWGPGLTIHI